MIKNIFKSRKILIILLVLLLSAVALFYLIEPKKKAKNLEFYTFNLAEYSLKYSEDINNEDYEKIYDDLKEKTEPVLTLKDISAYNPKNRIFILSDSYIKATLSLAKENGLEVPENQFALGGSIFLKTASPDKKMKTDEFLIVLDGEVLYGGHIYSGAVSSYIPKGAVLRDSYEAIIISYMEKNELANEAKLIELFEDMGKITDRLPNAYSSIEAKPYQVQKLWDNRSKYVGDNSNMSALIEAMPFPDGMTYKGFEIADTLIISDAASDKKGLRIELEGREASTEEWLAFDKHSEILFALIDNLGFVEFSVNGGSQVKGYVDSRTKELADAVLLMSSDTYKLVWTGDKRIASADELFMYIEPFIPFAEAYDYPSIVVN